MNTDKLCEIKLLSMCKKVAAVENGENAEELEMLTNDSG